MPTVSVAGRFTIVRQLGIGGMGEVYLAEDTVLHRQVAIKTIRPEYARNPEMLARLQQESKLHAQIGVHPHIVTLHDLVKEDGNIHLVMEYVAGESLQAYLERIAANGQNLPLNAALAIVDQTLDALAQIHAHKVVHRDVKPGNLLLTRNADGAWSVKLTDFGIARENYGDPLTSTYPARGRGPGTPLYMAPEQIDRENWGKPTPATDFYALGAMLYQLLSGKPPFFGTPDEVCRAHLALPPPSLDSAALGPVAVALNRIIQRAMSKRPSARYNSAKSFREALDAVRGSAPKAQFIELPSTQSSERTTPAVVTVHRARSTSLKLPGTLGAVALVLILTGITAYYQRDWIMSVAAKIPAQAPREDPQGFDALATMNAEVARPPASRTSSAPEQSLFKTLTAPPAPNWSDPFDEWGMVIPMSHQWTLESPGQHFRIRKNAGDAVESSTLPVGYFDDYWPIALQFQSTNDEPLDIVVRWWPLEAGDGN